MKNQDLQSVNVSAYITSPIIKASPINIPIKPLPKPMIRNSVEGLNQEIERLVLKNTGVPGSQLLDKNEEYDKVMILAYV